MANITAFVIIIICPLWLQERAQKPLHLLRSKFHNMTAAGCDIRHVQEYVNRGTCATQMEHGRKSDKGIEGKAINIGKGRIKKEAKTGSAGHNKSIVISQSQPSL